MSAWSTVVLSIGSAGIGAAAALTGTAMQLRQSRLDRERDERAAWRNRAAGIVGPILGVLDDMEPHPITAHGGRSRQTIENIGRRWWRARDDLLVFGAATPSPEIAAASRALAEAVARSWTSMTTLNQALQTADPGRVPDEVLVERAADDHQQATALARNLESFGRDGADVSVIDRHRTPGDR